MAIFHQFNFWMDSSYKWTTNKNFILLSTFQRHFNTTSNDAVVNHLEPIQKKYAAVREDEEYLQGVVRDGASAAEEIANRTLNAAKVAMCFALTAN